MTTNTRGIYAEEPMQADVSSQRIARVYAEALLNAADKHNQADAILEDLDALVREVFPKHPDLEAFFSTYAVGRDQKGEVLQKVFEGRATEQFVDFLQVLNAHDRLDLLRPIRVAYKDLRDQRARRVRVHVTTVVPLDDAQKERLIKE